MGHGSWHFLCRLLAHAKLAGLVWLACCAQASNADEPGITPTRILIGRTAAVTGPVAGSVKEQTEGAQAYLDWVNKNGGVHGRSVVLNTLDDAFEPLRAQENARQLVQDQRVFALFLTRGTPHTEAVLKEAAPLGIPVIAPSTGAELFHEPVNRLVFNVRAKYQDEAMAAVRHLSTQGMRRIAVLHVKDSFGADGLAGFKRGMAAAHLQPVAVLAYDRAKNDSVARVQEMLDANPEATLVIGSGSAVTTFIREARARGGKMQFVTLSNNASQSFVKELKADARGVMMTQVMPAAASLAAPLGREFHRIAPGVTPSYAAMEGFCAAKVLVEGLRRAGRTPKREALISALESMRAVDLGGMWISYSSDSHTGSTYVEMTMIDKEGRFIR